jgi:hypothetical protein
METESMNDLSTIPLTMSTLEIAGLTGKRHDHVLRDADKMLGELKINAPKFGAVYLDAKGEERRCLNLPKRECLILVSGYSVELRARIIDRWMQLEAAVLTPASFPVDIAEKIERMFGIERMLAHKVTEQGKIIDAQAGEIRELRGMIEMSPNRSMPEFQPSVDYLIEFGAKQRWRHSLAVSFGNRMVKRAEQLGTADVWRHCGGKRKFRQKFARACMQEFGLEMIRLHNTRVKSAEIGQGVLRLVKPVERA